MSEARSSGRLRKKPRISYAPPDDEEDLETIDEEGASSADSSDKTNVEIDDEFNPRNCKVRLPNPPLTSLRSQQY